MFNSNRLILARKRNRLTRKELAEKIKVSPVTITRIEKGDNEPDPSTIASIVNELGYPKEFFSGNDLDEPTKASASFRSLTSMTARERDAALSAGSLAYLLSDWVGERFNLPEADILDLGHEREPDVAARTLRQYWGLGEKPISNVIKLLESKGVRVFSLSENTKNVDAFSCWRGGVPYVFLNTFKTAEHSRFDALHELGHLVLHRHGEAKGREAEREANKFASYFLMPTTDVTSRVPPVTSLKQLIRLKKRWGVSVAALAYRLHKIDFLSDWQYRTFCIQLNKNYRHFEPEGLDREKSVVWEKVFRELWNERTTIEDVAKDLFVPVEEIENLIFGLTGSYKAKSELLERENKKPHLKVV